MWKPRMMPPTERNLQSAWKWILGLDCGGSRNLLGAFRYFIASDKKGTFNKYNSSETENVFNSAES